MGMNIDYTRFSFVKLIWEHMNEYV